jgi:hypothetical protein
MIQIESEKERERHSTFEDENKKAREILIGGKMKKHAVPFREIQSRDLIYSRPMQTLVGVDYVLIGGSRKVERWLGPFNLPHFRETKFAGGQDGEGFSP